MYSGDPPGCPTPESVGVAVVAGAGDVPTRSATAPVGRTRGACSLAGQPRSARVLPSATGVGPRSARWSRPWRAPGLWPGGTGSAVWLCHRGCTHAADQAVCPPVARTDLAAGSPGTGRPHLDTTREDLRLQRRGRRVR